MRKVLLLSIAFFFIASMRDADSPHVLASEDNYGAIAYSTSSGNYGYSYDYSSQWEAEQAALDRCNDDDCEILVWFANNCAALAKGRAGIGYAYGNSQAEAESLALDKCSDHTSGCRVLCWACNSR